MSFESPQKNISLYPERVIANPDLIIKKLQQLENGELPKIELSDKEKEDVLKFEDGLGETLEKITEPVVASSAFYVEYFLTLEGRQDFKNTTGMELEGNNIEEVKKFLFNSRAAISRLPSKIRTAFAGRTETFFDEKMLALLEKNLDEAETLEIRNILPPERIDILVDPKKALAKLTALRDFRRKILSETASLPATEASSRPEKVRRMILEIYRKKVNQLIAERFSSGVTVAQMSKVIGKESLSEEEQILVALTKGLSSPEKNYSRYDKFSYGASPEYDVNRTRSPIPKELLDYADKIAEEYTRNKITESEKIKEKGLDREKLFAETISIEQAAVWEEELLDHYGQRSAESPSEYFAERKGPASDDKWQFVARPEYKSMAVNGRQKIIKSGTKNKAAVEAIAILLGHETEGHALQSMNKSAVPLRLFRELEGDRIAPFSEGGAMLVEGTITQQAFGFRTIPHPHYIRAMVKRLEGSTYLDCVKVFFESAQKTIRLEQKAGLLDDASVKKETEENLRLAINRARRLFAKGVDYGSALPFLTVSKDTVYLEQLFLLDKLKQAGLEKYAFVKGLNLNNLAILAEAGLLDLNKIQPPKYYSLKIWERIKDNYKIREA